MPPLSLIALAIGFIAVVGTLFGLPDRWFFGLLSLTCMISGAQVAYYDLRAWAVAFLATGMLLAVAAAVAAIRAARRRNP
ncbi:hypothetical protein STRCI_001323 [Streptomyces cinnabarinus]|uniref:Uncharacterized protein n=1 Tax=Streptomyces cinnabarinus TaxID=67287 RepID=A0ABY7K6V5_9ACTN|nr:hypothetical protein [Streptomyces cinnabarinus]WAZ20222.1 hypothetical protein STRCI_001323 [Streptomyces cinnabarinus]